MSRRFNKVLQCQRHLSDLENPQVELLLLLSCLSLCKINHLIRTVPSDIIMKQLSRFDAGLRCSLESITHSSIPDLSWKQATLPVRLGGLGLRDSTRTSPAAFIASCNAFRPLVSFLLSGVQESASTFSSPLRKGLFFKGERVADDQLRRLLPAIKNDLCMSTQRQLQSLVDSAILAFHQRQRHST